MPQKMVERMTAREVVSASLTEAQFQDWVTEVAHIHKWTAFHPYDSRRSNAGWPDLVLIKAPRLIFAELKSMTGKVSGAQAWWLENLGFVAHVNKTLEVYTWRPSDVAEIEAVLGR